MEQMNITSAKYHQNTSGDNVSVIVVINGITIDAPLDPANRHYAEIMRQVEAGELVIEPADQPE